MVEVDKGGSEIVEIKAMFERRRYYVNFNKHFFTVNLSTVSKEMICMIDFKITVSMNLFSHNLIAT